MQERDYDLCPFCYRMLEHGEPCCDHALREENQADDARDIQAEIQHSHDHEDWDRPNG